MPVRINRVYTREGDLGSTRAADGTRLSKAHPRLTACGDLDELNCLLGAVKEDCPAGNGAGLPALIEGIQQELFDLGSCLSCGRAPGEQALFWHDAVLRLEELCDAYNADLPELNSFILPGGTRLAAGIHCARACARRAERSIVLLAESADSPAELKAACACVLPYINRLSDLLFILSRHVLEAEGKSPPLWIPAPARK